MRGTKTFTLMRKTILPVFLFALLITTWSCKKDDETITEEPTTYDDYACLKTGNYWIYQQFTVDSLGNATPTDTYDSCYIEKDTLINGKTYFKLVQPSYLGIIPGRLYLRDSLHYVVDQSGAKYFSSIDFTSVFKYYTMMFESDTIAECTIKMSHQNEVVVVPAGSFSTHAYQMHWEMHPPYNYNGTNRYQHTRYAKGKGIISQTMPFFLGSPNSVERRLVRSYIN